MKISKRQLKRIIKEERARLVLEMNPDGSISEDEDEARADLLAEVEMQTDELIQFVIDSAQRIGGDFRSPGIKRECKNLMLEKIQGMR